MKITAIECHILVAPGLREDATPSSQDDLVVLVHTDASPNCPFIECLPAKLCTSPLHRELADDGLTLRDGRLFLPTSAASASNLTLTPWRNMPGEYLEWKVLCL